MANQEHVDRLLQGVEAWNQWRRENLGIKPDLIGANLSRTNLRDVNLCYAALSRADLSGASLIGANLIGTDFKDAILSNADFRDANFKDVNLSGANLIDANLRNVNLRNVNLSGAILIGANLSHANLGTVQALRTNLQATTLTGSCIEDWNINSGTDLQGVTCEYVFTKYDNNKGQFTDRLPHDLTQTFAPGEFTKRYQIVLETVDLFFNDGIDWKAFLASLNDLQTEYGNEVNIQGIEKKAGGSFVVRLEVPSDVDKGIIERTAKELYGTKLQILEAKYHAELQAKDKEIESYRRESANMMEITKLLASKPITVEAKAVAENQSSSESYTNHFNHSPIGNFANKMQDQASMQTNQYIGANLHEITSLIQSLRSSAEAFPQEKRAETLEYLDDLEKDVQQPPEKRKVSRMKAALLALVGIATAVSGAVANTNEFVGQVQELSDKLGIPLPIEQVQPQQPKAIEPEQP